MNTQSIKQQYFYFFPDNLRYKAAHLNQAHQATSKAVGYDRITVFVINTFFDAIARAQEKFNLAMRVMNFTVIQESLG